MDATSPEDNPQTGGTNKYIDFDRLNEIYKQQIIDEKDKKVLYLHTSKDIGVYIMADKKTNSIFVVFRGPKTIKNSLSNFKIRFAYTCKPIDINDRKNQGIVSFIKSKLNKATLDDHASDGLFAGPAQIESNIIKTIIYSIVYLSKTFLNESSEDNIKIPQIYTFGHSMGGALSTIFSYFYVGAYDLLPEDLQGTVSKKIICITYGSPRVFNKDGMETFVNFINKGRILYLRTWTDGDWIPTLPPAKLGFYHPIIKNAQLQPTLRIAKTWYNLNRFNNESLSTNGIFGTTNNQLSTAYISHCFEGRINFFPVIKRFTIGNEFVKDSPHKKLDYISTKIISIGSDDINVGESTNPIKSLIIKLKQKAIISAGLRSNFTYDKGDRSYKWFLKNIINKLSSKNNRYNGPNDLHRIKKIKNSEKSANNIALGRNINENNLGQKKNNKLSFADATCYEGYVLRKIGYKPTIDDDSGKSTNIPSTSESPKPPTPTSSIPESPKPPTPTSSIPESPKPPTPTSPKPPTPTSPKPPTPTSPKPPTPTSPKPPTPTSPTPTSPKPPTPTTPKPTTPTPTPTTPKPPTPTSPKPPTPTSPKPPTPTSPKPPTPTTPKPTTPKPTTPKPTTPTPKPTTPTPTTPTPTPTTPKPTTPKPTTPKPTTPKPTTPKPTTPKPTETKDTDSQKLQTKNSEDESGNKTGVGGTRNKKRKEKKKVSKKIKNTIRDQLKDKRCRSKKCKSREKKIRKLSKKLRK